MAEITIKVSADDANSPEELLEAVEIAIHYSAERGELCNEDCSCIMNPKIELIKS